MKIDENEMMDFFEDLYAQESAADDVKKTVRNDLKDWGATHEVSGKALASAYRLYKSYASGKLKAEDTAECSELNAAVEKYFSN